MPVNEQNHVAAGVLFVAVLLGLPGEIGLVSANGVDPTVSVGSATFSGLGTSKVTIHQGTPQVAINWRQLNLAPNEVMQFIQPSASAIALNRIADVNPSQIFGTLQANGIVMLLNPNGVLFGPTAQVNVGGLIASSLHLSDSQFLRGQYRFEGTVANGSVKNAGHITAGKTGVYLLAPDVENSGVITSPEGHIALAAGTKAYLSERPDGRGLLVEVSAPAGRAVNLKDLVADGGQVSMVGKAVNQEGLVQANSVRERKGKIELYASAELTLKKGSQTLARGDAEAVSDGGTVMAIADKTAGRTTFERGAVIDISGGAKGGNGGFAEVSGQDVALGGTFRGGAAPGYKGGQVLIDPQDVTVDSSYLDSFSGSGMSKVEVQADRDITVNAGFDLTDAWALPAGEEGILSFKAGHDLKFDQAFLFNDPELAGFGSKWSYLGTAGNDIILTSANLWTGRGGNIELAAARDIRLVQAGSHSYLWTRDGGNITLNAGRDLVAPTAFDASLQQFSGVRLDGRGDLTMTAGRDLVGGKIDGKDAGPGFVLTDGQATVTAGGKVGAENAPATLTVGKAQVTLDGQGDVFLGLVQDKGVSEGVNKRITMDPTNRIDVTSRTGDIHLNPSVGSTTDVSADARRVYPASFRASAPQGSILLDAQTISFWPSTSGSVEWTARDQIKGVVKQELRESDFFQVPLCFGRPCTKEQFVALGMGTIDDFRRLTTPPLVLTPVSSTTVLVSTASPADLIGSADLANIYTNLRQSAKSAAPHDPVPVTLKTETGDISTFRIEVPGSALKKQVTISSGNDIKEFQAVVTVPEGVEATVSAARDINMKKLSKDALDGGIEFIGKGTGRVIAGRNLDLADSQGITHRLNQFITGEANQPGLLDITVGGNLEMTKSKIFSFNGAGISIHGPAVNRVLDANGLLVPSGNGMPPVTQAVVSPVTGRDSSGATGRFLLKPALNQDGTPKKDGLGNQIYDTVTNLDGTPILFHASENRLLNDTQRLNAGDLLNGNILLDAPPIFVGGQLLLIVNGKVLSSVEGMVVNGQLVLAQHGTPLLDAGGHVQPVFGRPALVDGRLMLSLTDNGPAVSVMAPVGGTVNVGANSASGTGFSQLTGIVTQRGGAIDIKATGDVNVNSSRVATLGGGAITVTSATGDINAGSGGKNDKTGFVLTEVILDGQGNPIPKRNPDGTIMKDKDGNVQYETRDRFLEVPGSGIFTFHPDDPAFPLPFPAFDTPEMKAIKAEIIKQSFLGRDTTALNQQILRLSKEREPVFNQIFDEFVAPLKLGDISLTAARDIVVPPAGIRGRKISLTAGRNLDLQGGTIEGQTKVKADQIKGDTTRFVGNFNATTSSGTTGGANSGGGGTVAPLSGTTSATAPVSATASSSSTASGNTSSVKDSAADAVSQQTKQDTKTASSKGGGKGGEAKSRPIRVKQGVTIQVDVKAAKP